MTEPRTMRVALHAMGTRFEVVLAGGDPSRLRSVAEAALERVAEWERRLNRFDPGSLLAHVNRRAGAAPVRVGADVLDLVACCADVHERSGGAFDVTVGPLMEALGFHADPGDVAAARALVGMHLVELDIRAGTLRLARAGMSLDMGAVGKGQALDDAAEVVRDCGVTCGLLHGGTSTVVAIGSPPGRDGWRIRLGADRSAPIAVLRDAALSVSSPRGRMIVRDGAAHGHVLDPRTAEATRAARLAAVIGDSARLGDAWSTALLVLGGRPVAMPADLTTLVEGAGAGGPHLRVDGPAAGCFTLEAKLEPKLEPALGRLGEIA